MDTAFMTLEPPSISNKRYTELHSQYSVTPARYSKPIRFYCDVDGVIKPEPRVSSREELEMLFPNALEIDVLPPYSFHDPLPLKKGLFWWDAEVIERLGALSRSPHVDFVWLTDWRVSAPHALDALLGIESIGFLDWDRKFSDYNQVFKREAIIEEQEEAPSKFIWLDDRANRPYGIAPHPFAEEKYDFEFDYDDDGEIIGDVAEGYDVLIPATRFLNITTDSTVGVTLTEVEIIEEWVKKNI